MSLAAALALVSAAPGLAAEAALVIEGGPKGRLSLASSDLASLPRAKVARDDHGKRLSCEGVLLIDLLTRAGLPTGKDVRGAALSVVIVAAARDGYRAAFTLGELDRSLGNAGAVIADRCEGKALGADRGPFRLVFPRDERGARSVRQLERLIVTTAVAR